MAYLTAKHPLGPYTYRGLIVTNHNYPNAGNVHGSFEPFQGQYWLQYHKSVPGLRMTRVPNLEPLVFNDDGTIREVKMSTSGVRGAFGTGDTVQAGGAVEYSTGRKPGIYQLKKGAYSYISFREDGQWACYRYFSFPEAPNSLTLNILTGSTEGILEVRKGSPDGPIIASATLPDTGWKWKEITLSVECGPMERETLYLAASRAPPSVRSFRFGR